MEPTIDQLHDEVLTATDAYAAKPDEATKKVLDEALGKYKPALETHRKTLTERAANEAAAKEKLTKEGYKLELPKDSTLPAARVEQIVNMAKEKGMSNEQAQQILQIESESHGRFVAEQQAGMATKIEGWKNSSMNDPEYGGQHFQENLTGAKRVIAFAFDQEFVKMLDETGLGSNPSVFKGFAKLSKLIREDQLVTDGKAGGDKGATKSNSEVLYDHETSKQK